MTEQLHPEPDKDAGYAPRPRACAPPPRRPSGRTMPCSLLAVSLTAALACGQLPAHEPQHQTAGPMGAEIRTTAKAGILAQENDLPLNLWRLRFGLAAAPRPDLLVQIDYEHRTVPQPAAHNPALAVFPSAAPAPYRIRQLDAPIVEVQNAHVYRHELDRACAAFHLPRADFTLGRQAVGWGRGAIFSAVDVFAPFSPLEVDREWRRGIDAVRADLRLGPRHSLDLVGAFGESWDRSAALARLRGSSKNGQLDGALILGKRGEDWVYAASASASLLGAAIQGELALFDTPEPFQDGCPVGENDFAAKTVLGASYVFDVGNGLTVLLEHHFSGFGSEDMQQAAARLLDPDYLERYLRGDTQILGRQALALQCSYLFSDSWHAALLWLASPEDGSGITAPTLTWTLSDTATLAASAYIPFGSGEDGTGVPQSEYGSAPLSAFVQLNLYR
ncbi:MAG: hypothetical protein JXR37_28255 [Kiritimatiellae bacterium]|nr:hypothetical protein [Kiritimatiellia bacterium]